MSQKKNYNRLALQGMDIDDMEFVKEYNLDASLAYTPALNDAMLEKVYELNIEELIEDGVDPQKARSEAGKRRAEAKSDIEKLLK
jgi:hypothetical protein